MRKIIKVPEKLRFSTINFNIPYLIALLRKIKEEANFDNTDFQNGYLTALNTVICKIPARLPTDKD